MDSAELRALQQPLKDAYREDPEKAVITLRARGQLDDAISCSVETGRALAVAGLHPASGGDGTLLCSGDMLLQALVACAGVTLRAVATSLKIDVAGGTVAAEGDLDFRGTLAVSKDAPVGFRSIRLAFDLDTDASAEQVQTLIRLTERYCMVYQTLAHPAEMTISAGAERLHSAILPCMTPLTQIVALAMAPDASWAVTVSADGTVRTRGSGVPPRLIRQAVPIDGSQPVAVALAGDRLRVLWADGETIRLHENVKGAWPRDAEFAVPAPVRALALSPSGVLAVAACADGTLRVLNTGTGQFAPPVAFGGEAARAVAVASEHGPVAAAFGNGTIRRYDLAAGIWQMAGDGPGIALVAVSPDGTTVIAASAEGYLLRWATARAADFREIGTAATAIAVDGTGGRVLAGRADGTLWLYDMAGGAEVEFGPADAALIRPGHWWDHPPAASPPPAPAAARDYAPPPSPGRAEPRAAAASLTDDDVRFTVYRPQAISPGNWASLLVFAHKTDLVEEPGKPPLDPNERVEAIARAHFGNTPVRPAAEDARSGVLRGTRLRVTADLPGLLCNPSSAEFDWWEPVHHVEFRLQAPPGLVGSVVRGAVRVWRGPLILGEVSLAISITASLPAGPPPAVADSAARYRKIFPSYSHADGAIVDAFTEVARTLGDEYLRDVVALRVAERWRERLPELIKEADVFQLFWSSNSMRSRYCREEWEYALSLGRPLFVRPFYWEDPRPSDPANGLPPPALDVLQFVKVSLYAARAGAARPAEPDHAPPTRPYPIPGSPASPVPPLQAQSPEPPATQVQAPRPPPMSAPEPPTMYTPAPPRPADRGAPASPRAPVSAGGPPVPDRAARRAPVIWRAGVAVAVVVVVAVIIVFLLRG